jgi:type II secretory pathway component GspD/PulD (secretin)
MARSLCRAPLGKAPDQFFNREQNMKKTARKITGAVAACGLAALSAAAPAQDSSKMPAGGGAEIQDVIAKFAKRANRPIVIDPRVRAQVPLAGIDADSLSYDQLLAVLSVHQFAMVNSGGILAVVPDAYARQSPSPIYTDRNFKAADYEIVNLLVTPKKVCAAQLVPVLRPLQPQAAHLAAEIQTNTLIINDHAVNARKIAALVERLDERGTGSLEDCQRSWGTTDKPNPPGRDKGKD